MASVYFEFIAQGFAVEVESWESGLHCWRIEKSERSLVDGHLSIGLPQLKVMPGMQAWYAELPVPLLLRAEPFGCRAIRMMSLARRNHPCKELLMQRPVLLLLALMRYPDDDQAVIELVRLGQRKMLGALDLSPRRSVLRFLDRLELDFSSGWQTKRLMELLSRHSCGYRRFGQVKNITPALLHLDSRYPQLTGSRLSLSVMGSDFNFAFTRMIDSCELARIGLLPGRWSRLRRAKDCHQAWRMSERWHNQVTRSTAYTIESN